MYYFAFSVWVETNDLHQFRPLSRRNQEQQHRPAQVMAVVQKDANILEETNIGGTGQVQNAAEGRPKCHNVTTETITISPRHKESSEPVTKRNVRP